MNKVLLGIVLSFSLIATASASLSNKQQVAEKPATFTLDLVHFNEEANIGYGFVAVKSTKTSIEATVIVDCNTKTIAFVDEHQNGIESSWDKSIFDPYLTILCNP